MPSIFQSKETRVLINKICFHPENPHYWIELADLLANAGYRKSANIYYYEAIKVLEVKYSSHK